MTQRKPVDYDRRLKEIEDHIREHSAALSAMKKEKKQTERAARTHLLCDIGGAALPYLREANLLKPADFAELMAMALKTSDVQSRLNQILIQRRREAEMQKLDENGMMTEDGSIPHS